jgi:hypothetical protein
MAEFARRRGVQAERVRRWRLRLLPRATSASMPRLVELVTNRQSTRGQLQIRCPSGHVVEMGEVELDEGLRAALLAIGEASRC